MTAAWWTRLWQFFARRVAPQTATEAWRERREQVIGRSKPTFDAYPEHHDPPKAAVLVRMGRSMETVDLDGYSLEQINWEKPFRQRWFVQRTIDAYNRALRREQERKAQKERRPMDPRT